MKSIASTLVIFIASMLTFGMLSACQEKKKDPNARTDTYATGKITFGADESDDAIDFIVWVNNECVEIVLVVVKVSFWRQLCR